MLLILPISTATARRGSHSFRSGVLGARAAMMEAATVSALHRGKLPLPASVPPPNHHLRAPAPHATSTKFPAVVSASSSKPPAARLTAQTARSAHPVVAHHSSRAATGYAAALADACVRAGTLRRASRHARALLRRQEEKEKELDARVAALVRMLVGRGKAGMVAEVMAEFAAICDHLMHRPSARAQYYYAH